MKPVKFNFGGNLPVDADNEEDDVEAAVGNQVPFGLSVKDLTRRVGMLALAKEVVTVIPGTGEAFHALMTGRYDLMILLTALLEKYPSVCDKLRIATLSMRKRNIYELLQLIDQGKVLQSTLLVSDFFRDHNPEVYPLMHSELQARGQQHQLASARSHCKVITMSFADGTRLSLEGSANLRTNSNIEQFCLINHNELHDWHASWIDEVVSRGQKKDQSARTTE